jgi:hypothetical protein
MLTVRPASWPLTCHSLADPRERRACQPPGQMPQPAATVTALTGVQGLLTSGLSQTSHQLEADGPVIRDVRAAIPPAVEYCLSGPGQLIATKVRGA